MKKKCETRDFLVRSDLLKILLMMKFTVFFLLIFVVQLSASVYSQETKLKVNFNQATIKEVIDEIEKQTDLTFFFSGDVLNINQTITLKAKSIPVDDILNAVSKQTGLSLTVVRDQILVKNANPPNNDFLQQQKSLSGKVTDSSGTPLPGVTVLVKGTTNGTVTNVNGEYTLTNVPGSVTLLFSFVGMKTQEIEVAGKSVINVVLEEDSKQIDDVVVLGYGATSRKQDLSAAVGVVSNTEELVTRPSISRESMLQGQIAGVTVSNDGGSPDSSPNIIIRGQGSKNGDGVLWVVDGVPGGPIPSTFDIESIVVLKDAASAAIYGAQSGAGGVILVTTKKAKIGEPTLTYDVTYGARQATNLPQSLTAEEEIEMYTKAHTNAGLTLPMGWDVTRNPWVATTRTDWMDEIFRTALFQKHSVSLNVGTDRFKSRFSLAYDNDQGTLIDTYKKSYSLRYNGSYDLNKWVTIKENIQYTDGSSRGADTNSGYSGVILSAIYMPRSATVYKEDGSYGGTTTEDQDYINTYGSNYADIHGDVINPVRMLTQKTIYKSSPSFWSTTSVEIANIVTGLKFTSIYNFNTSSSYSKGFTPKRPEVGKPDGSNSLSERAERNGSWNTENTLTYDRTFGKHTVGALASTTANHTERRSFEVSASGFASEEEVLQYLKYATSITANDEKGGPDANVSVIGRLAYSYDDRYFATASFRRDYAGRLVEQSNYGDFPAVTAAWKISNENFFNKTNLFSLVKVRGSWGRVGNLGSISENYKSGVLRSDANTNNKTGQYGLGAGIRMGTMVYYADAINPNLTWETSEQTDIGLDVEMFNERLYASFDYFDKRTFNLIQGQSMGWPQTIGLNSMLVNQGEIRNRGFEMQVTWNDNISRDFSYYVTGNLSTLKNWVSDIGVRDDAGNPGVWSGGGSFRTIPDIYQTVEGEPLNSFFLIETDGIFQSDAEAAAYVDKDGNRIQPNAVAGDLKFVDFNEDGKIDSDDRQYMGNAVPELTYAFTLGFNYKKLSVSAMFQGVKGAQAMHVAKMMNLSAVEGNFNRQDKILDAWSETNTSSDIPRLSKNDPNGNFSTASDWYLEDASYMRFKNLTVSYDLTDLIQRSGHLSNRNSYMSVYFSGENLYTFTKYSGIDPECGGYDALKYPVSRVLSVGVRITY